MLLIKLKIVLNSKNLFFEKDGKDKKGRIIKLINPYEGKFVPISKKDNKDYLDLTKRKNLKDIMTFYNNVLVVPGKQKYSDSPSPLVVFHFGDMQLIGLKVGNIKFKDEQEINFDGKNIDSLIEKKTIEFLTENQTMDNSEKSQKLTEVINNDYKIQQAMTSNYQPSYENDKFSVVFYKNMLGIKMDKYILFFKLGDNNTQLENIKKLVNIKKSELVADKRVRFTFIKDKDGDSYKLKITGKDVENVEDIPLEKLEKIHVFQSNTVGIRSGDEQVERRQTLKQIRKEGRNLKERNRRLEIMKGKDQRKKNRFINNATSQRMKNLPGQIYDSTQRMRRRLKTIAPDEYEEFLVETDFEYNEKDDVKLAFKENLGTGAQMTIKMEMQEIKEQDIKLQINQETGENEFAKQFKKQPPVDKNLLYIFTSDPLDEYTIYGLANKPIYTAMYGTRQSVPKKTEKTDFEILSGEDEESNLWEKDDYEKPLSEAGRYSKLLGKMASEAQKKSKLYSKIFLNKAGATLSSFENLGLVTSTICIDNVPVIEEPIQVNWIFDKRKMKILKDFQKKYLESIVKLEIDAEENKKLTRENIGNFSSEEDLNNNKKSSRQSFERFVFVINY